MRTENAVYIKFGVMSYYTAIERNGSILELGDVGRLIHVME
jgi:hypothetical protein